MQAHSDGEIRSFEQPVCVCEKGNALGGYIVAAALGGNEVWLSEGSDPFNFAVVC